MAKNQTGPGGGFRFTGQAKNAGDLVVSGDRVGVVAETVASGDTGWAYTEGEFECTILGTDTPAANVKLWYDNGNSRLTTTSSTHKFAGWSAEAKANGPTKIKINLAGGSHAT